MNKEILTMSEACNFIFSHGNQELSNLLEVPYQTAASYRARFNDGRLKMQGRHDLILKFGFLEVTENRYKLKS